MRLIMPFYIRGLACWLLCSFIVVTAAAQLSVGHLLTENKTNPIGVDAMHPRFSWQLEGNGKHIAQSAYEIKITTGGKLIWNSGKVATAQSVQVPYQGAALQSVTQYQWQVRVWDQAGHATAWSQPAAFVMGLLQADDWKAQWIEPGYEEDTIRRPSPVLKKDFNATKKIATAWACITAHGLYEAQINGHKVGDAYFTPGWTCYDKRLQYQVYDVTDLLQNGGNGIQVTLASGWYRGTVGWRGVNNFYGKTLALLFQLEITYTDGTKQVVVSDDSWQSATGPIRYSEIYNGEIIDARRTITAWSPVKVMPYTRTNLIATEKEPVVKKEVFTPVKIFTTPAGDTVADFGQNLVGFVQLTIHGQAGDILVLDHAEVLDKAGNFYNHNLRSARAQDIYVLKGAGEEHFEPHFTYHGFRYARLRGFREGVKPAQLKAVALYADMPQTGSFECSDPLINQLQHNIAWTQNGNFLEIPTDCPQRDERMGWAGDAQLFSRTAVFNQGAHNFFVKWLKDVMIDQFPDGAVPHLIPNILGPGRGTSGWSDVCTIVPWTIYQVYGDTQVLINHYASMKAWVDCMVKRSGQDLLNTGFQFGDWLSFRSEADIDRSAMTAPTLIQQVYYAYSTQLLINAARVLGKTEEVAQYTGLLARIKQAFLQEYRTPNGRLMSNTQTAYVLTLQFDMLPENMRADAAARLVENIKGYDYHITSGILGCAYICHVLSRFGYTDVAYRLLQQETYPSWLYPVKLGATTIWERWNGIREDGSFNDSTMNSFNQYTLGTIGDWLYRGVAGIETDDAGPGYRKIIIRPHPGGNLSYVKASLQTYYGTIAVHWKKEDGQFSMDVDIPANTTATIYVPQRADGSAYDTVAVGSGSYHFAAPMP